MAEDEQATSSVAEETEAGEAAEASAETKKTDEGPKPNYVPQSRLNEMAAQKRDAEARYEDLSEKMEQLKAELANRTTNDDDPATKDAKDLITETAMPLIERSLSDLRKEITLAKKELAEVRQDTTRSSKERQWQQLCDTVGADPNNKELMAVTAGLSNLNLTNEDALKRALQMLPGAAKNSGSRSGASVETSGLDGVPSTSDWVPKTSAEAAKGAHAGKRAKQLSTSEILALKQKRA